MRPYTTLAKLDGMKNAIVLGIGILCLSFIGCGQQTAGKDVKLPSHAKPQPQKSDDITNDIRDGNLANPGGAKDVAAEENERLKEMKKELNEADH